MHINKRVGQIFLPVISILKKKVKKATVKDEAHTKNETILHFCVEIKKSADICGSQAGIMSLTKQPLIGN